MARRRAPWMLEHSRREAERKDREKAERKARGNRLYAVLAWRPDGRYSGKDVWRWFKREADAEKWARGFHQGQGVAVREYTSLNDANAEWIPERAAKLVADFLGTSAEPARHHATKKSAAQLQREIDDALAKPMTGEQIERYRSGRRWGWPADLSFKVATGRPLSRTPGRRSHATKRSSTEVLGVEWSDLAPTGIRIQAHSGDMPLEDATPAEIRRDMNRRLAGFRALAHVPARRKKWALSVYELAQAKPWVMDQVPHDVWGLVLADVGRGPRP